MSHASGIEKRIEALPATKRYLLADRLGEQPSAPSTSLPGARVRLTAFVTVAARDASGPQPTAGDLRAHLEELLPEYMVPTHVQLLDSLPQLPNGKVDIAELRETLEEPNYEATSFVKAQSPVERVIEKIWCKALHLDQISVHDNFFDLGGDSILSVVVVSRIKQQGLSISPNDLFNFPTIAALAIKCRPRDDGNTNPFAAPSDVDTRRTQQDRRFELNEKCPTVAASSTKSPPFFLVHGGHRLKSRLGERLDQEQPLFLFNAHWDHADLDRTAKVEQLAEENLLELTSLQPAGPYFLGGYSMGAMIALEMAQKLVANGEHVEILCLIEPPRFPGVSNTKSGVSSAHTTGGADKALLASGVSTAITSHFSELQRLSTRARLRYIGLELTEQFRYRMLWPVRNLAKMALSVTFRRLGIELPKALRRFYVAKAYSHAWSNYRPKPYTGPMVIFHGHSDSYQHHIQAWEEIAEGELTVEQFKGKHLDFQNDPDLIRQWGPRLAKLLAARQQASAKREVNDSHLGPTVGPGYAQGRGDAAQ